MCSHFCKQPYASRYISVGVSFKQFHALEFFPFIFVRAHRAQVSVSGEAGRKFVNHRA